MRPHAVTAVGAATYQYDANGNLTNRNGKAITWNADNTVQSMVGPDTVPEGYTCTSSQISTTSPSVSPSTRRTSALIGTR